MTLALIILFTFLGSIVSLFGTLFFLVKKPVAEIFSDQLISFAAGTLIATAFLDLLPEAKDAAGGENVFMPVFIGFIIFFLAERFIQLFHHHHTHNNNPSTYLVLIGDGVHNFIDGVSITASFLASPALGITTSLAVAAHEIPQEIADMTILLANGLPKSKAIFYNLLSALTSLAGALIAFYFATVVEKYLYIFLGATAGFFIYISASDLIPELHDKYLRDKKFSHTFFFLFGIIAVFAFTTFFEGLK